MTTSIGTSLSGRRAIVTGSSRGIGRAIALALAQQGADLCLVARSAEGLAIVRAEVLACGSGCTTMAIDVTGDGAADRIVGHALEALGGIDILVNNAGGSSFSTPLSTMRDSGWRKTMDLNLDSPVRLIQAALPALVASGNASIVNVASIAGLGGVPHMSHYGAAKAALISVTRTLAIEVAAMGVRVNALVPGWIDTDLTEFLRDDEGVESHLLADVPMRRWGTAEEIAQGALFLASDASSFMTGQVLVLDGGLTATP